MRDNKTDDMENEHTKPLKILLLEDIPTDAELVRRELTRNQFVFTFCHVTNIAGFEAELSAFQPDLVLSDFQLPGVTGLDALELFKKRKMNVPFIIVTGSVDEETAVKCLQAGADDYILKENLYRLAPAINSALEKFTALADKRKAEEALLESETMFRLLAENSIDCIWKTDIALQFTYLSPSFFGITGYRPEECTGVSARKLMELDAFRKIARTVLRTIKYPYQYPSYNIETILINRQGEQIPVEVVGKPLFDAAGTITGLQGTAREISERKAAEKAIRDREERFRNVVMLAPFPIMIHTEGRVLQLSDVFTKITGYTSEDVPTLKQWHTLAHPEPVEHVMPLHTRPTEIQHTFFEGEWIVSTRSGNSRIWNFSSTEVGVLDNGQPIITSMAVDVTEKRHIEMELFRSRQELNAIFQEAPVLMMLVNEERNVVKINQTALNFSGKTRAQVLGRKIGNAINCVGTPGQSRCGNAPECDDCVLKEFLFDTIRNEDKRKSVEISLTIEQEGRLADKTFLLHTALLVAEPEKRILVTMIDLTERKIAEQELKESEEKYRRLIENAPVGITLVNNRGEIEDTNNAALLIFGLETKEELIGTRAINYYVNPDERTDFLERLHNGVVRNYEIRMKRRDGSIVWVMETSVIQVHPDGQESHLSIMEDITLRKETEEKIRAYQENLEELVKARTLDLENTNRELFKFLQAIKYSPVTVVITDVKGNIEYVNPHFTRTTGYTADEVLGKNPRLLKSGNTDDAVYKNMWQTILSGKVWIGEFENRKKNGELLWEACSVSPIFTGGNKITHFVAVKEDITEKREAEARLKAYTSELEMFNRSMVDRELRIIEMKEEVNRLSKQLGIGEKYPPMWNEDSAGFK